ncbi:hypothetical protein AB833_14180 [Chromatiales bacterium (ex Bugula neritina AB1)]|nr:hypothetical protein AB833_14180 [Chromatiales bacterium (ex Bugula neritina AB1)]
MLPGLLSPAVPVSGGGETRWLNRLLGRATTIPSEAQSLEQHVYRWFNGEECGAKNCAARLGYLLDAPALEAGKFVLRTDPVYQQMDINNAILADQSIIDIEHSEALEFIQTLNRHFDADGLEFGMTHPGRWYCRFPHSLDIETISLSQAAGRDVAMVRPVGEDSRKWRGKLTEIEMLLHEHPVNEARAASGKVAINSLWAWGEGVPAQPSIEESLHVYTNNFYTQSLARFAGVEVNQPEHFCISDKATLFVEDRLARAAVAGDQLQRDELLVELEETLFEVLWNGLGRNAWRRATLWGGGSHWMELDLRSRWAFWRQPRSPDYFHDELTDAPPHRAPV